ncbi:MAG: DEAD/DEAH box helicase, partial [Phycisphaerales bacterium]
MTRAQPAEPLPVRREAAAIADALRSGGALVLTAATGSGKTTQVPQIVLESGLSAGQEVVLEPRRLAARMTARRVAQEMGCTLGEDVGYQTRFERVVGPRTRVRFVTEGVFLRQAQRDPSLAGIGCVLLDEFHERSVLADLALGTVRAARERRGSSTTTWPSESPDSRTICGTCVVGPRTRVRFVTEGVFLRQAQRDPSLAGI